jgi:hypothetical protein
LNSTKENNKKLEVFVLTIDGELLTPWMVLEHQSKINQYEYTLTNKMVYYSEGDAKRGLAQLPKGLREKIKIVKLVPEQIHDCERICSCPKCLGAEDPYKEVEENENNH